MEKYNLTVGTYNSLTDISLGIPEGIKFFYNEGEIGDNVLIKDCQHYHTVVETEKYNDWLEDLGSIFGVWQTKIGKYTIVSIYNVHDDTPVPTVDREEWFEDKNIDFSPYVIVGYNDDLDILNLFRISEFISPWNIRGVQVTRKSFVGDIDSYSLRIIDHESLDWIISPYHPHRYKIKEGTEAETLWSNMVYQVLKQVPYDTFYVDDNYDFDKDKKELFELLNGGKRP